MYSLLILAAGESRRMGKDIKQLLPFGKHSLLEHVLLKFLNIPLISERIVVLGSSIESIVPIKPPSFKIVVNKNYKKGMTSSLKIGLSAVKKSNHLIFMPFDYPLLKKATIESLIRHHKTNSGKIIMPSYKMKKGHPVIFDRVFLNELSRVSPKRGAREVILKNSESIVYVPTSSIGVLLDIDTPLDYRNTCN